METITTTETISAHLIHEVTRKLARLNKRAAKIGATPLKVELDNERVEKRGNKNVKVVDVTVIGAAPILNGWELAAKLEHSEVGNVIRTSPRFEDDLPVEYRTAGPNCDHCNIKRARNNTYVLHNEAGEWIQVGSSCLADFIGNDPAQVLWVFEESDSFVESEWENFSTGPTFYKTEDYLTHVVAAIRLHGWVSRSQSYSGQHPTADVAHSSIDPAPKSGPLAIEDTDKAEAEEALKWVRNIETPNDFLHNIHTVGLNDYICYKDLGFAAAIVMAYQKEQDRLRRAEREAKLGANSVWVGEIKKRQEFTLKVERIFTRETAYGLSFITTLHDEDGNVYTWFASSKELEIGKTYTGKATVKDHTEYNGIKQTVITRFSCEEVN